MSFNFGIITFTSGMVAQPVNNVVAFFCMWFLILLKFLFASSDDSISPYIELSKLIAFSLTS